MISLGLRMHQDGSFDLGARVIWLDEGQNRFHTWIRLENGLVIRSNVHYPNE